MLRIAPPVSSSSRARYQSDGALRSRCGSLARTGLPLAVRLVGRYLAQRDAEAELGYMHRNFEKMAESRTYTQVIPYTDRLNYCSSFMNGHGWALAVEKLLGIQAPPRAEAIRVILSEFSRIMDHIICVSTNVVDLGGHLTLDYHHHHRQQHQLQHPTGLVVAGPL